MAPEDALTVWGLPKICPMQQAENPIPSLQERLLTIEPNYPFNPLMIANMPQLVQI